MCVWLQFTLLCGCKYIVNGVVIYVLAMACSVLRDTVFDVRVSRTACLYASIATGSAFHVSTLESATKNIPIKQFQ